MMRFVNFTFLLSCHVVKSHSNNWINANLERIRKERHWSPRGTNPRILLQGLRKNIKPFSQDDHRSGEFSDWVLIACNSGTR